MIRRDEKHRYTYEDLLEFPEGDGNRYEIIDGELIVTPSPGTPHQRIFKRLAFALDVHVERQRLGEVFQAPLDVRFADGAVIDPDIFFLASEHADRDKVKWVEGPVDLAVEILSPSTAKIDRTRKRAVFAKHGVPYYWIVDGDARVVEELRLEGADYVLHARVEQDAVFRPAIFQGLEIPLGSIWAQG